ncbi:uncharacterized protein OCT59_022867 [Rhizophagus irregularis]|uniref:uncharacterized protein n=1 Tax=Rhizophagus irregularis TaxID=588596 RepID=UPI0033274C70|nr:hypothetical protein OCT59_022867 [Rhizophagus irregularis]
MDFLKCKSELEYIKLLDENISLELANMKLEDTLTKKKDELMWVKDDLLSAQKAVIEKDSFLQETNFLLLEHISKTSSESKQNEAIGGDKGLEKDNEITSPEITSESPYSLFFQHAIIFIITGLPPMKLYLMDMDKATRHKSSQIQSHSASPSWPFLILVTGKSGLDKTNILANLFLGNKAECIYKDKKGPRGTSYGSRYRISRAISFPLCIVPP